MRDDVIGEIGAHQSRWSWDRMFPLADPPDYEPSAEHSVAARAAAGGHHAGGVRLRPPARQGRHGRCCTSPLLNYADGNLDVVREMLRHEHTVVGLADGGAHVGTICDASFPTTLLTHWVRDRTRGAKWSLAHVVAKQTSQTAAVVGLGDRGVLAPGMRADVNVIDLDRLTLHPPTMSSTCPPAASACCSAPTATCTRSSPARRPTPTASTPVRCRPPGARRPTRPHGLKETDDITIDRTDRPITWPFPVISADSHITEAPDTYLKYIDPAWRDRAPHMVDGGEGVGDVYIVDGMPQPISMGLVAAAGKPPEEIRVKGTKFDELHRSGWDADARLADQRRDGVSAEVIYPTVGMVLCNHPDADYKRACFQAYNRWIADYCDVDPARLLGCGQTRDALAAGGHRRPARDPRRSACAA